MAITFPEERMAVLRDGTPVRIRPIRPGDVPRLMEFHSRLSLNTTRLRFFTPMKRLSQQFADHLCTVDFKKRCAFVISPLDADTIHAVGRYEAESRFSAEGAFVVEDSFQGKGIGTILLDRLVEHARANGFDRLTATLATREQQLGEVIDAFAEASSVLADERKSLEELVAGLADLSQNGLALLSEHAGPLRADIETLAGAASTIDANLAAVTQLLASGPLLTEGIIGAYNPQLRAINLRNNFGPLVPEIASLLGLCALLPPELECLALPLHGASPTPATLTAPGTPVSALADLMATPTEPLPPSGPRALERAGAVIVGAAAALLGVGS